MTMLLKRCCLRLFITTASLLLLLWGRGGGGCVDGKATDRALEDFTFGGRS